MQKYNCHLPSAILIVQYDIIKPARTRYNLGAMISTWKKRNYVVQMADGSYKKVSTQQHPHKSAEVGAATRKRHHCPKLFRPTPRLDSRPPRISDLSLLTL